jgi:hypothetical protein
MKSRKYIMQTYNKNELREGGKTMCRMTYGGQGGMEDKNWGRE